MEKKITTHTELEVYQKAFTAAMKIFELSKRFPKEGTYALTDQIRRSSRFTDADLHKLILGAALNVNPFRAFTPTDIRRLCIEQHAALAELARVLPEAVIQANVMQAASFPNLFLKKLRRFTLTVQCCPSIPKGVCHDESAS